MRKRRTHWPMRLGWHVLRGDRRAGYDMREKEEIEVGQLYSVPNIGRNIYPCLYGFHACPTLLGAVLCAGIIGILKQWAYVWICRVEVHHVSGERARATAEHQFVGSARRVRRMVATPVEEIRAILKERGPGLTDKAANASLIKLLRRWSGVGRTRAIQRILDAGPRHPLAAPAKIFP